MKILICFSFLANGDFKICAPSTSVYLSNLSNAVITENDRFIASAI